MQKGDSGKPEIKVTDPGPREGTDEEVCGSVVSSYTMQIVRKGSLDRE